MASTTKRTTKPVRKKSVVRVGGKKSSPTGWRRWRTLVFVLVFAIVGSVLLYFTLAATTPNCASVSNNGGSTMELCANITSSNTVLARADFVGKGFDSLKTGTVTLNICSPTTLACAVADTSSQKVVPNQFAQHKSYLTTAGRTFVKGTVYQACVTFTSNRGWQQSNVCSKLVTFGNGYPASASEYQPPPTVTPPPAPTPTPTGTPPPKNTGSSALNCGNESAAAKTDGTQWTCTFDDEFDGSALNTTLWNVQTTAGSGFATPDTKDGNARACYMNSPSNVSVSGGYLSLTARQESSPFTCSGGNQNFTTTYTAGEVQSQNKFSQQYGRFEVSAMLPSYTSKGLQETLWLWPNNDVKYGSWPYSGEYDFSEFYSKLANLDVPIAHYVLDPSTVNFNSHTNTYTPIIYYDSNFNNCYINVGQFNTYTAFWQPGYLEIDVNGKPCLVDNYTASNAPDPAPFDQPFFLALTQALGIWPLKPQSTTHQGPATDNAFVPGQTPLPATTQIDYVRVWK